MADDVKKAGTDLKKAGVIGPETPDRKFDATLSATTYGAGIGFDYFPTESLSFGGSIHSGGMYNDPTVLGRVDWKPLQKNFPTNNDVGPINLSAGPWGGVLYNDRVGLAPVVGGTIGVEHVKSGFNVGLDVGILPVGSSKSHGHGHYGISHSANNESFVGGKIGWKF